MADPAANDNENVTAELLDDDVIYGEYPPDEPLGVDERLTPTEEQSGESFGHRVTREDDGDRQVDPGRVGPLVRPGGDEYGLDSEADEVAIDLRDDHDSTLWDVTQEKEGVEPAEVAAMHLPAPPPMHDPDGYVDD